MSNTNVDLFRERFTSLRKQSGLSIADLSNKTGISETGLRNYESKKENRMPRVFELIEIATTFNVSSDYLLGLSDVRSRDTNMQAVCEFTGLSEKAVKNITLINEQYRKDITFEDFVKLSAHKSE